MITLATEGRKPLFGYLTGDASKQAGSADSPRLQPSPLGDAISEEVRRIPTIYPQIRIITFQLMPDHLHVLLYVTKPLPCHLGQVVAGFKAGCNRRWREIAGLPSSGLPSSGHSSSGLPSSGQQNCPAPDGPAPDTSCSPVGGGSATSCSPVGGGSATSRLWEKGYHDRVLSGEGQLRHLIDYIHDNPRRSLVKRQHRELFQQQVLTIGGMTVHAIGNVSLLQASRRLQVRCSRRCTPVQQAAYRDEMLAAARQGAVLVSPFISEGERMVEHAALAQQLPLIIVKDNGFPPFYKPAGQYFEACAEGRLLLVSCYDYSSQQVALTRQRCDEMNMLAMRLCTPAG